MTVKVFKCDSDGRRIIANYPVVTAIFSVDNHLGELMYLLVIDGVAFEDFPRYTVEDYELEVS